MMVKSTMPSVHAIASVVFLMRILNAAIINPTSSNSTHQYYINTDSALLNNFQSGDINCGTTYCHIVCDENDGCSGANIDASISDTLIIECPSNSSCYSFTVNGPKKNLNVNCWGVESCRNGKIYAPETENTNLSCSNWVTSFENKACLFLLLNASQSTSVTIDCLGRESCYEADFYLDYAHYATIDGNGYNALYKTRFYANYMTNQLDVVCRGSWVCHAMIIYSNYTKHDVSLSCYGSCELVKVFATEADMESSVSITCNGRDHCRWMSIYCPIQGSCNINCVTSNSCNENLIQSKNPTQSPTTFPTSLPTQNPTIDPTFDPTIDPTNDPTIDPTAEPTTAEPSQPTSTPIYLPSKPTMIPIMLLTNSTTPTNMDIVSVKATYNDPSEPMAESSYDSLLIVAIVICIILGLMFIVCVLIYLKLHKNNEKHDNTKMTQSKNSNVDMKQSPKLLMRKSESLPKSITLPSLPTITERSQQDVVKSELKESTNDESYIGLQAKQNTLSVDLYANLGGLDCGNQHTVNKEGEKSHTVTPLMRI